MASVTVKWCPSCCDPCAALPDTLNATIAGIVACGCYEDAGGSSHQVTAISGINGSFTAVEKVPDTQYWRQNVGTFDLTSYTDSTCSAGASTITLFCTLFVTCGLDGDNLRLNIDFSGGDYPTAPTGATIFAGVTPLGTPIANGITCAAFANIGDGTGLVENP